jgi:hypothetical protein
MGQSPLNTKLDKEALLVTIILIVVTDLTYSSRLLEAVNSNNQY